MKHMIADLLMLAADALDWFADRYEGSGLRAWLADRAFVDRDTHSYLVVGVRIGARTYVADWSRRAGFRVRCR